MSINIYHHKPLESAEISAWLLLPTEASLSIYPDAIAATTKQKDHDQNRLKERYSSVTKEREGLNQYLPLQAYDRPSLFLIQRSCYPHLASCSKIATVDWDPSRS